MPAPGDQHRPSAASANPFEDAVPRVSEYTAIEIATLQSRLDKQLGPEYISTRPGAGGSKVHYLAAEKVINLANEVFGFNGWSSQIQNIQIDFCDEHSNGKISLGLSVITRVTLKDGTFHEDIGYGQIENCKGKAAAFEKAKKEAATDALKRALRNFGNVLGNCLYDKDYLAKITKIKVAPSKWHEDNLHRHQDFAPIHKAETTKAEPLNKGPEFSNGQNMVPDVTEFDDDFGGDLFDDMEMGAARPDEVVLHSRPDRDIRTMPPPNNDAQQRTPQQAPTPLGQGQTAGGPSRTASNPPRQQTPAPPNQSRPPFNNQTQAPNQPPKVHEPPVGFITSRAAELLQDQNPPNPNILSTLPKFNPLSDSPSIRKTSGVNHSTSAPVLRAEISGVTTAGSNGSPPTTDGQTAPNAVRTPAPNVVNPSENLQRRIGAPGGGMSPLTNRTAYKAPTMAAGVKRAMNGPVDGARTPLADVSNTVGPPGEEVKKQRLDEA